MQALELQLHGLAQVAVERRERLVQQEEFRPVDDRARQGHPLLLAAGKLTRLAAVEAAQPNLLQGFVDPLVPLFP